MWVNSSASLLAVSVLDIVMVVAELLRLQDRASGRGQAHQLSQENAAAGQRQRLRSSGMTHQFLCSVQNTEMVPASAWKSF